MLGQHDPYLLETSVGWFEVEFAYVTGEGILYVQIFECRDGVRHEDYHRADEVARASGITEMLLNAGVPKDESENAARRVFSDAVLWARRAYPDSSSQILVNGRDSTAPAQTSGSKS